MGLSSLDNKVFFDFEHSNGSTTINVYAQATREAKRNSAKP